MLIAHGEKEEDTEDHPSERGGQSDTAPDNEEGESHQNHETGEEEVELPLE